MDDEEYSKEVKALGFPRQARHKLFCLRQELIDAFFESRYMMFIKLAAFHLQQLSLQQKVKPSTAANSNGANRVEGEELNGAVQQECAAKDNDDKAALLDNGENQNGDTEQYKKIVESITKHGEKSDVDATKDIVKKAAAAVGSLKDTEFDIRFNPDVYSESVKHSESDADKLKRERQLVKDAAEFVLTVQIPSFVSVAQLLVVASL